MSCPSSGGEPPANRTPNVPLECGAPQSPVPPVPAVESISPFGDEFKQHLADRCWWLYYTYYGWVYSKLRDHDAVEDVFQQANLNAFNALERCFEARDLDAYLKSILRNAINHWFQDRRRHQWWETYGEDLPEAGDPFSEPDLLARLCLKETIDELAQIDAGLVELLRLLIAGKTQTELAEMLGIQVNTLRQRLHRARKRFKELLDGR